MKYYYIVQYGPVLDTELLELQLWDTLGYKLLSFKKTELITWFSLPESIKKIEVVYYGY